MTVTDISAVQCKLFGVSFLRDEEHEKVKKLWESHFYPYTAFFVRGNPEMQISQIAQNLCLEIQRQNIAAIAGETVIIALFLDFTEELSQESIEAMAKLPGLMKNALHCNVSVVLQFGYVGKLAFANASVQRENAKIVVSQNVTHEGTGSRRQLCLVASPTLAMDDVQNWKAVVVFLDLLRRQSNPTLLIPGTDDMRFNNDVGFLSYGEHSDSQRTKLANRARHLNRLLGDKGGDELRLSVEQKLVEIERSLEAKYHIDGTVFPLHTGLIVENKLLFCINMQNNQKKAARGEYAPYNEARNNVISALTETVRYMKEEITSWGAHNVTSAQQDLEHMIDSNEVGLELLEQQQAILNYLDVQVDRMPQPQIPTLQYKETGCLGEITTYLSGVLAYNIRERKKAYVEALKNAYGVLFRKGFSAKKEAYNRELQLLNQRLSGMCDAREFYTKAISGYPDKQADFHPFLPNGKETVSILIRGSENIAMAASIGGTFSAPTTFTLNEQTCGTPVLDDAPMKVLGVMFKDCDDKNLLDLIPEVLL